MDENSNKNVVKNRMSPVLVLIFIIIIVISFALLYLVNNLKKTSNKMNFENTVIKMNEIAAQECILESIKKDFEDEENLNKREIITHYNIVDGKSTPSLNLLIDLEDGDIFVDSKCKTTFKLYNDEYEAIKDDPYNDYIIKDKEENDEELLINKIMLNNIVEDPDSKPGYFLSDELESNLVKYVFGEEVTYYFRGNVTNNYVSFGKLPEDIYYNTKTGYTTKKCNDCEKISKGSDMIFRITRVNSNGSIRLVFDRAIGTTVFNVNKYNGAEYFNNDNTINNYLNEWLLKVKETNEGFEDLLVIDEFCNGGFGKISDKYNLTFNCQKYSDNSLNYKGSYEGIIGILSADEVGFAGLKFNLTDKNKNYFLNNGSQSWTMSYSHKINSHNNFVTYGDHFDTALISEEASVRPVINIKPDTVITKGNGRYNDPYVIKF